MKKKEKGKKNGAWRLHIDIICFLCFVGQPQNGPKSTLHPTILEEILSDHKAKVREIVKRESERPKEHLKIYDKYMFLINKQVCIYTPYVESITPPPRFLSIPEYQFWMWQLVVYLYSYKTMFDTIVAFEKKVVTVLLGCSYRGCYIWWPKQTKEDIMKWKA